MNLSSTEENYLKAIYKLSFKSENATTNDIAEKVNTKAASVTDMIKKLSDKSLVYYEKYKGVHLSPEGIKIAKSLVRQHRLWEVFLVDKLGYKWDEVHDLAEQLEHITDVIFIDRLDSFLGKPRFDPHGDPIPDSEGNIIEQQHILLSDASIGQSLKIFKFFRSKDLFCTDSKRNH
jgi:DtxR family Mn-dependent transcriptional regulator